LEECWPCPVFANYTLAFDLQLREKHGKTSVRVAEEIQSIHIIKTPTHYKTHPPTHTNTHTHTHITKQFKTTTVQIKTQYKLYPNEIRNPSIHRKQHIKGEVKGTVHPITGHEGPEG
jgi:NADH:ubiquinone oxidoreductase subunit D